MSNTVLLGYVGDKNLPFVTKEDAQRLTHINVAFGYLVNDEVQAGHMENLRYISVIKEYNKDIKILLSVGGWGADGFSAAAATINGRKKTARSAAEILSSYDFDGIDLDWEYPCYGVAGIRFSPNDKITFTLLLKEIRETLEEQGIRDNKKYLLTIAAGADQYYIDGTQMHEAEKYLDFVSLMTYDMRGGFQTLTGHHTNLFASTGDLFRISTDASVRIFVNAGVPRDKLLIGAAFYSRLWRNVPNVNNGLHQISAGVGGYGPEYYQLAADYIDKNGYVRYWDDEAKAPYLFNGQDFISYDDEISLKHKCTYVKHNGLAGIMYFEHEGDKSRVLLNALYKSLYIR